MSSRVESTRKTLPGPTFRVSFMGVTYYELDRLNLWNDEHF